MVFAAQRNTRRQSTRRSTRPPASRPEPTIATVPEALVSSSTVADPDTIEQTVARPPAANISQGATQKKKPGLRAKPANDQANDDTEFLRGIGRGAQVWTTYVEETREYDDDLVDGWNRSLDVTLVFAALFSAILTAFVLESVKNLSPDPLEVTAVTLLEIANILRGTAGNPMAGPSGPISTQEFTPTINAVWVNGLWFFSLSLSVAVSLAAMLAKEWCYYFLSARTGDPITQAEERQKRYNGLEKWRMKKILEFLPMLMHLSLALFSIGLVLYLWDINVPVAAAVTSVSLGALLFYLVTTLVPVKFEFCPFKTPQSHYTTVWINALTRGRIVLYGLWGKKSKAFGTRVSRAQQEWKDFRMSEIVDGISTGLPQTNLERSRDNSISWFDSVTQPFAAGVASVQFLFQRFRRTVIIALGPEELAPQRNQTEEIREAERQKEDVSSEKDEQSEGFVRDSLSWLIEHSQNSTSIDTAIGALAIGRVQLDNEELIKRISSRLVKGFSDCFVSSKTGVKLRLAHSNMMNQALDYTRWMTHFAGAQGIKSQVLSIAKSLGIELVTHLGLSFACLAKLKTPVDVSKNITLWISSFIKCYDADENSALYFSEEVLSVLVDGLSTTGLEFEEADVHQRAQTLAIPQLISILWKVSHVEGSQLRQSIGLNLAVFALSSNLSYPMTNNDKFDSVASHLATKHTSTKSQDSDFIPLVVFALLGFLHPKNPRIFTPETTYIACRLIHETGFLVRDDISIILPKLDSPNTLHRRMAVALVQTMAQMTSQDEAPQYLSHTDLSYLWITSAPYSYYENSFITQKFETILHAICHLINDHVYGKITVLPEILAASMTLLSEEIAKLGELDYTILDPATFNQLKSDLSLSQDSQTSIMKNSEGVVTDARRASFTLACVISKSKNKQCIEAAVRSILHHSNKSSAFLVIKAADRFAEVFQSLPMPSTQDGSAEESTQGERITASGYGRVLASMAAHCAEYEILAEILRQQPGTDADKRNTFDDVQLEYERLAAVTDDSDIRAFGVAGLATWKFACLNRPFSVVDIQELLNEAWGLIAAHPQRRLRPEALEALVDTTSLFSAITEPTLTTSPTVTANPIPTAAPSLTTASTLTAIPTASDLPNVLNLTISPDNARHLLKILAEYHSELEDHVRPALAVALTFWGLSLDNWKFWTVSGRRGYWRHYVQAKERSKDMAGLFLLGLSRLLEHDSQLLLDHASISAIAYEVEHQMNAYSGRDGKLTLPFLSNRFDVRRHVRQIVGNYLQETAKYAPFTKSVAVSRGRFLSAIETDGGEGYIYEEPQPFAREKDKPK